MFKYKCDFCCSRCHEGLNPGPSTFSWSSGLQKSKTQTLRIRLVAHKYIKTMSYFILSLRHRDKDILTIFEKVLLFLHKIFDL